MYRSILVPLDGSTFGEHALPLAASLARRTGAVLHLAHVHQVVPPATIAGVAVMDTLEMHMRQDEQAYLADVVRRLNEKPVQPGTPGATLNCKTALLDGEVEPALKDHAQKVEADLVVMSTHGRGALGRFWLGSVADDLVHDCTRPVLLVRPQEGKPDLHHEPDLSKILLPVDGSPLAERIIEPAMQLGKLFDSTFVLVNVVQPVLRPSYLADGGLETVTGLMAEVEVLQKRKQEDAQAYLNGVAARLGERGCKSITRMVVEEQPAVGILHEAQSQHVGLIAMETHARSGLSRLFLGSVADKVVRGSVVPVLLNRPVDN